MTNYVKFQRGTLTAYQTLLKKGLIDPNTLYFIYSDSDSTGSLYMGERIISGGDTNYVFSTLDELSDVEITNAESNSFLVKDNTTNNWIAKTPAQVADLIQEYIKNNEEIINLNSDNLSVEIIDNIIQLKNYGSSYYAFVPATENEASHYILTEGFKAGLEPRVEETNNGLVISWYEPNSEITDNLNSEVNNIKLSIKDLNSILNTDDGLVNKVDNLENKVGFPSDLNNKATGLYEELEKLLLIVNDKANTSDIYTKEDADKAIAAAVSKADHLQRKIINSINDIDTTAEDAHLYIYMVPTGLQNKDDKYNEYVVINNIIEKIGSWEVDLDKYVTKDEIIIKSVSDNFTINNNKQLILNDLSINKITNLQNELNNKINIVEGHTLLSPEDQRKLAQLNIDDDNNLSISGSILRLENWLNEKAGSIKGLSENNLTDELYEKISKILITSVEETQLNVDEAGKLSILEINQDKIVGLTDTLNNYVLKTSYEDDIEKIKKALTWEDI